MVGSLDPPGLTRLELYTRDAGEVVDHGREARRARRQLGARGRLVVGSCRKQNAVKTQVPRMLTTNNPPATGIGALDFCLVQTLAIRALALAAFCRDKPSILDILANERHLLGTNLAQAKRMKLGTRGLFAKTIGTGPTYIARAVLIAATAAIDADRALLDAFPIT